MTQFTAPRFDRTGSSLGLRASRTVLRALVGLVRALRDRQEVKRLIELDDRALKDIGLSRSEVDGALAEPLFRNPSAVLVRSVERRSRAVPAAGASPGPRRPVVPVVKKPCAA
jgi:uncharacterized protein YjiS (DUF1127 family)